MWVSGECVTKCTWCVWRMILKDITRTLLRCRLLNKMKGMKPTRERYIRSRSQTWARKSLTGPTPEKDNAAKPESLRYTIVWLKTSAALSVLINICYESYHLLQKHLLVRLFS